jgi:flagellar operon protein (TIGR03826 family)
MEVRNCPNCGRLFNYIRTNLCPVCIKEAEEEFQKVRIHLRDNPNISIIELAEDTGVEEDKIIQWIREGRIESKGLKEAPLKCVKCGVGIYSGTHCAVCSKDLADDFSRASQEMQASLDKERSGPRFHTRRD